MTGVTGVGAHEAGGGGYDPTMTTTTGSDAAIAEAGATADPSSVRTSDGVVQTPTHVAGEDASGSTTPEHLMAAALSSCLQQSIGVAASSAGVDASGATVEATVTLASASGQPGYTASFALTVSGLAGDEGRSVFEAAQAICPFTKALAGAGLTVELAA